MEDSIVKQLQECGPLDVKQLVEKLGKPKKDINRVLYDMERRKIIEQMDNGGRKGPPVWMLRQGHVTPAVQSTPNQPSAGVDLTDELPKLIPADSSLSQSGSSTSMGASVGSPPIAATEQDEELEKRVLQVLRDSRQPLAALTIARHLGLTGKRDVNPVLFKLREEGIVKMTKENDSKPLWQLVGGHTDTPTSGGTSHMSGGADMATWDDQPLYTVEGKVGERIVLNPLKKDDILSRALQPGSTSRNHGDNVPNRTNGIEEVPRVPIQESTDDHNSPAPVKEKAKINPINLTDDGQAQIPELKETQHNINPSTEEEEELKIGMMSLSETASDSVSMATNNGTKKVSTKKKMAARFPPTAHVDKTTPIDTPTQRQKILELLTRNTSMTTKQISTQLGMETRAPAYEILEQLEHDGKVQRTKQDGDINVWSLADDD